MAREGDETCAGTTVVARNVESNNSVPTNHPGRDVNRTIVPNEASEATNPTDLQEAGHLNRTNAGASNRAAQTPRIETVPTVRIGPIVVNPDGTTAHEEAAQT